MIAPCPLCHSPGIEHPAGGYCVAGASCSNGNCLLHRNYQDETNRHVRLDEWPKPTVLDEAVEAARSGQGLIIQDEAVSPAKQDLIALEDYTTHLEAKVNGLIAALGYCSQAADGRHQWGVFPVDQQGRLVMTAANGTYAAASFCRVCMMPRSPYHNTLED